MKFTRGIKGSQSIRDPKQLSTKKKKIQILEILEKLIRLISSQEERKTHAIKCKLWRHYIFVRVSNINPTKTSSLVSS